MPSLNTGNAILSNPIKVDSSYNVGIGGAASGSFKLQVTGTGNFTGALSGTSATFSGTIQSTTTSTNPAFLAILPANANATILQSYSSNSGFGWKLQQDEVSTGDFRIFRRESNVDYQVLNLARSTGAATFSSSVTASGLNLANTTNGFVGLRLEGTGTYAGSDWTIYASSSSPSSADDFLGFFNNSTTDGATADYKLRIFKNGNVGIGTSSPSQRLSVSAASTGYVFLSENSRNVSGDLNTLINLGNNANNTSSYFVVCSMASGDKMYVYGNGNIVNTNNSYGTLSDATLKENIIDATPKLADILQLKVRNFNLIGDDTKQIGFIAQEFEEVFPSMIDIDGKSGKKAIKTSVLVPMLVKAIQELNQTVQNQQQQINSLINR